MTGTRPTTLPHTGLASRGWMLALLSASFLAVAAAPAQDFRDSAAPPRLSIAAAANASPGCDPFIVGSPLRQDMEARLRAAGAEISTLHTVQLASEIDCVGTAPGVPTAVHQCLAFSELVSAASREGRPMLAATWRQCQSYTCWGRRCEASVRSELATLMNTFMAEHQDRFRASAAAATGHPAGNQVRTVEASLADAGTGVRRLVLSLYIAGCIGLLLYWRIRKRAI